MRSRASILVLLLALALPGVCAAQTDYSLRIRSLDVSLAGLLDDYLTDVYLNPARLSGLDRSMVYGGNFPQKSTVSPFPIMESESYYGNNWIEDRYFGPWTTSDNVALSWLGRVAGAAGLSVGGSIGQHGSDRWDDDYQTSQSSDRVRVTGQSNGNASDVDHYEADLSIAPLSSGAAIGVRLRATYDVADQGSGWVTNNVGWLIADPANPFHDYEGRFSQDRYEMVTGQVSVGRYDPASIVSDLVIGAVYTQEQGLDRSSTTDISDNDPDGNGTGYGGGPPEISYLDSRHDMNRDYRGFGGFVRCHLRWMDRLISTHAAGWGRSEGDGGTEASWLDQDNYYSMEERLDYTYDGTLDRWSIESSIGYSEALFEDALFAFGIKGEYSRLSFREDAGGEFFASNSNYGEFQGPFSQTHDDTEDELGLMVPIGFEWSFHKYFTLRVGSVLDASRTETDRKLDNNSDQIVDQSLLPVHLGLDHLEGEVRSDVSVHFNTGLGFNFNNRFIVDLASHVESGSINLANFSYLSARFMF